MTLRQRLMWVRFEHGAENKFGPVHYVLGRRVSRSTYKLMSRLFGVKQ